MLRVKFDDMKAEFERVLLKNGFPKDTAELGALIFTETSCDGVYSHGVNRFPRIVEYVKKGYIDVNAKPTKISGHGGYEKWDGNLGLGNVNAKIAMNRAIELSKEFGIGLVALQNTNHWMRGGTYGWQAAKSGCVGICWTNTMPNMPAWGAKDRRIGNNPIVFAVPRENGDVVVDMAMAQFSYGKMEAVKLDGKKLPVSGGFDSNGELTTDPAEIVKTRRVLPIGYWKGSALSIVLDMIATVLSGGNSCYKVGKLGSDEYGLSQIFIAIDTENMVENNFLKSCVEEIVEDIKCSIPADENSKIYYPGEKSLGNRIENLEKGIPVHKEIWDKIKNM